MNKNYNSDREIVMPPTNHCFPLLACVEYTFGLRLRND